MSLTTLFGKASNMDFYTSGNFIVPIHDTDILLKKAILTIDLADGEFVEANVYYELYNLDVSKNISIKFEAKRSDKMPLDITQGIKDFKLMVNGDIQEIKSDVDTCYMYYANVQLIKGKNILRNTFRYRVMDNVDDYYLFAPFCLRTLNRWANRQVDDFTLRVINGDRRCVQYYIADEAFRGTPFNFEKDKYNFWRFKAIDEKYYALFFPTRSDTLVWHKTNFCPNDDMAILSSISSVNDTFGWVVENNKGECVGRYDGDCGDSYLIDVQDWGTVSKEGHKVVKYSAEDGKGCVYISSKVNYTTKNGEKMQIVNVRALPSTKSSIIGTISELYGDLPSPVDCLGYVPSKYDNSTDKWFKVNIDGKIGYVRADLMEWDSIGI